MSSVKRNIGKQLQVSKYSQLISLEWQTLELSYNYVYKAIKDSSHDRRQSVFGRSVNLKYIHIIIVGSSSDDLLGLAVESSCQNARPSTRPLYHSNVLLLYQTTNQWSQNCIVAPRAHTLQSKLFIKKFATMLLKENWHQILICCTFSNISTLCACQF